MAVGLASPLAIIVSVKPVGKVAALNERKTPDTRSKTAPLRKPATLKKETDR